MGRALRSASVETALGLATAQGSTAARCRRSASNSRVVVVLPAVRVMVGVGAMRVAKRPAASVVRVWPARVSGVWAAGEPLAWRRVP